tara:strand:+ start:322 stop:1305 length:984 start_codon:yes stop_codon:yes gene_type:complete
MKSFVSILGGSGFLGTRLSALFKEKNVEHKIFDISFEADSPNYVNVEEMGSLNKLKDTSVIINLAAIHRDDIKPISRYDDVNIHGAENVCNFARKNNVNKIIFTSSVAIYGFAPKNTGEDGEPNFFNDYGRTKYEAELIYKSWQNEKPNERSLIVIRPTVIFGEGNRGNVYNLLNQIYCKRFIMIGKGKNIKSMAYVENVAAFIEYNLDQSNGIHTFNYIDKPDLDMNTLVQLARYTLFKKNNVGIRLPAIVGFFIGHVADVISNIFRISLPISSIRIKKFLSDSMFSSSVNKTKFIPPFKLSDALIKTIKYEFIEDNKNKKKFYSE